MRLCFYLLASIALFAAPPAAAAEQPVLAPGNHRLQQVALTCSDLDRSIAFYRDTLGLELLFTTNGMAFFRLSDMRLMIAIDRERPRNARPQTIVYLDAPDFEYAVRRLQAAKVALEGEVETVQSSSEGALKLQQFVDPDGNALAIMGYVRGR